MVIMGDGMRPLGKLTDTPPYPTITRASHFYPDCLDQNKSDNCWLLKVPLS